MITENNIKILNNIIANLSYDEYYKVNYNTKTKKQYKKHRQYSLTDEILKASELLKLAYKEQRTAEQEEEIKAFILKYKLLFDAYTLDIKDYIKLKYKIA